MTSQQLLVRDADADAPAQLDAVDIPPGASADDVEAAYEGMHVPHLGTQDLLALAQQLAAQGYRITEFDIRDAGLRPLQEGFAETVSETTKSWIVSQGINLSNVPNSPGFLSGLVVVGVEFRDQATRKYSFKLSSDGTLSISAGNAPVRKGLLQALQEVWRLAGLS